MTLTNDELTTLLDRLLAGWENEVVEFKEAARQFSADKTGEYVSALSNEANLRGLASGWLVFGVSNARQVVGTTHLIDVQQRQTGSGLQIDVLITQLQDAMADNLSVGSGNLARAMEGRYGLRTAVA